jgi:hypothetical protein
MKRLQEGVQKKIKDSQTQRGKLGFKSVAEVDQRIEYVIPVSATPQLFPILMTALSTAKSSLGR